MKVFKLFRKLKDGSLSPLFINKKLRLPINEWLEAELCPTKGYSVRKGWHCTLKKEAKHLSEKNRVWCLVEVEDFEYHKRPKNQGGTWIIAQKIKILKEL